MSEGYILKTRIASYFDALMDHQLKEKEVKEFKLLNTKPYITTVNGKLIFLKTKFR